MFAVVKFNGGNCAIGLQIAQPKQENKKLKWYCLVLGKHDMTLL
jgi:hypothetical protein